MKILNLDLMEYLINLQNVVDCKHYQKSYNLHFFDELQIQKANQVSNCLQFIDTSKFSEFCSPICDKIKISKITEDIEGDYEFLNEAYNNFDQFLYIQDDGFLLNDKTRKFLGNIKKIVKSKPHDPKESKPTNDAAKTGFEVSKKSEKSEKKRKR